MDNKLDTLFKLRFDSNISILILLEKLFVEFPELRFGQLLTHLNQELNKDQIYYEESKITFERYKGFAEVIKRNSSKQNKGKKDAKAKKPKKGKAS